MVCGDKVVAGAVSRYTKPAPVEKPVKAEQEKPEEKTEEKKRGRKRNAD